MYLEDLAKVIESHIPEDVLPGEGATELLLIYAVLARAKGTLVSSSDVHDAWAAWIVRKGEPHPSLVEYDELPEDVQRQDQIFVTAIQKSAVEMQLGSPSAATRDVLFPLGPPQDAAAGQQALELYKVMVQSSEALVSRRQGVNTFFLTMNGALLTGAGLVLQNSGGNTIGALGIAVFSLAGAILCGAWRSLIISFGQLNRGKFQVIGALEKHLRAAIYSAEWEALGRGEDPKVYRSFTSREIWVPNALLALHIISLTVSIAAYSGVLKLK